MNLKINKNLITEGACFSLLGFSEARTKRQEARTVNIFFLVLDSCVLLLKKWMAKSGNKHFNLNKCLLVKK